TKPWTLIDTSACLPSPIFAAGTQAKSGHQNSEIMSGAGRIDSHFGWATLTSISGFVGTHIGESGTPNGPVFKAYERANSYDYSEEVRLAGDDDASHAGGLAWQL